ncbi:MAG: hypothetical protein V9H26_09870 [Verrucomicrobiota bacterium]
MTARGLGLNWATQRKPSSKRDTRVLHGYFKPLEERLRKRQDQGTVLVGTAVLCLLASFRKAEKLFYQEIQYHPRYALDVVRSARETTRHIFLPTAMIPFLLAALNSPLMWWHNWRYLPFT